MSKVEKFKELLEKYAEKVWSESQDEDELKEELIKLYEEKQEKPVIYCREYEVIKIEDKLFYVLWQGKFDNQTVVTHTLEEKDGILITDDFIFIKEELK